MSRVGSWKRSIQPPRQLSTLLIEREPELRTEVAGTHYQHRMYSGRPVLGERTAPVRPKMLCATVPVSLCWLRRNMTFDELGENFGIGTTTAWTTPTKMAECLAEVIEFPAAKLQGQVAGKVCLVDSTLLICTGGSPVAATRFPEAGMTTTVLMRQGWP